MFLSLEPIAGSAGHDHQTEELSFDDEDLKALREFLGPEVTLLLQQSQVRQWCRRGGAGA